MRRLRQGRDRLHQSIFCGHIKPSASQWWCLFTWYSSMLEWRILPWGATDSKATVCHAWDLWRVLYLPAKQYSCSPSAWDNQSSETTERETPAFISLDLWLLSSTDLNPVNYRIWGEIHDTKNWCSAWSTSSMIVSSKASSMTQTSLSSCEKRTFWAFNLISCNAYVVLHILFFIEIFGTISKCYCVKCNWTSSISVFCIGLSYGEVTPLKCGGKYDINFVAAYDNERSLKVGRHLSKLRTHVWWHSFWPTVYRCESSSHAPMHGVHDNGAISDSELHRMH